MTRQAADLRLVGLGRLGLDVLPNFVFPTKFSFTFEDQCVVNNVGESIMVLVALIEFIIIKSTIVHFDSVD